MIVVSCESDPNVASALAELGFKIWCMCCSCPRLVYVCTDPFPTGVRNVFGDPNNPCAIVDGGVLLAPVFGISGSALVKSLRPVAPPVPRIELRLWGCGDVAKS